VAGLILYVTHRSFLALSVIGVLLGISLGAITYNWWSRRRVKAAPGWGLRRFAQLAFSTRTFKLVIEPCLSDLEVEYLDALANAQVWRARFVLARGYYSFWSAAFLQIPMSLLRLIVAMWRAVS